jgi:hypothetical protein
MAGDGNTGGGGSVCWSLRVSNADDAKTKDDQISNGKHKQKGRDQTNYVGENFTITIRIPQGYKDRPDEYLTYLKNNINKSDSTHVQFFLPIEDDGPNGDHKQINIQWGAQSDLPPEGSTAVNPRGAAMSARVAVKKQKRKKSSKPAMKAKTKPGKKR